MAERTPPLLEREREMAAVAGVVEAVASGRGGAVWIEGPAGIGKTRLLRAAREHAGRAGAQVLCARPGPLEQDFAFGVARTLFEPAVTARPDLLTGAAALAAPVVTVVGATRTAVTAERLHGLYWLTVGLADHAPLLLVLDDAHWADEPSLQALSYLVRRVEDLPVGVLVATRPDAVGAAASGIRNDPATVRIQPGPLSRAACAELVRHTLGPASPAFLAACQDAANGNPLLLSALVAALRDDAVAPADEGVAAVRDRAQAIVATYVLPRLRHLPAGAAPLARAVAVLGPDAELRHAATLAGLAAEDAIDAADALVDAELLTPERPLGFHHPLLAEVVLRHMSDAERHRSHLRAARCLAAQDADPERIAAHLLVVERLGDPWVVARLRAAAAAALAKGAPQSAAT